MKKLLIIWLLFVSLILTVWCGQNNTQDNDSNDISNIEQTENFETNENSILDNKQNTEKVNEVIDDTQDFALSWSEDELVHLSISSPDFENNGNIPSQFTCDWEDLFPKLNISWIPENTKSLAILIDDPDASNWDWIHFLVGDIPVDWETLELENWEMPEWSVYGVNSWWNLERWWPCPPSWTHRYFFKIYAFDQILGFQEWFTREEFLESIEKHVIDSTELVWLYSKN